MIEADSARAVWGRNLEGLPIKLEILDGHALHFFDSRFDAVICQLGLMCFNDPARGLSEFRRVLREGGWVAVSRRLPNARFSPALVRSLLAMLPRRQKS